MDSAKSSNPRSITLALINAKLDTVLEKMAEFQAAQKEQGRKQEELEERQHATDTEVARIKERLGIFSGLAVLVSGLVSAAINALTRK